MNALLKIIFLIVALILSVIGGAVDGAINGFKAWNSCADTLSGKKAVK